jgi:hypothetical protein
MKPLTRTLAQVRDLEVAQLGHKGIPNAAWPLTYGNDCLKFQLYNLGVVSRSDMSDPAISIRAFLGTTQWERVTPANLRAGDLALMQFDSNPDVDHIGLTYSRIGNAVRTLEANTSPKVGMEITKTNRGVYDKTRDIGSWLVGGVRPPYKPEAAVVPASKRAEVRLVLGWLDTQLPKSILRSTAGPTHEGPGDGVMGPVAWLEVQEWGDLVGIYPSPPYEKDGIPAGRSRFTYGEALKRAKAAMKR